MATAQVVTFWLWVMVLVEESNEMGEQGRVTGKKGRQKYKEGHEQERGTLS